MLMMMMMVVNGMVPPSTGIGNRLNGIGADNLIMEECRTRSNHQINHSRREFVYRQSSVLEKQRILRLNHSPIDLLKLILLLKLCSFLSWLYYRIKGGFCFHSGRQILLLCCLVPLRGDYRELPPNGYWTRTRKVLISRWSTFYTDPIRDKPNLFYDDWVIHIVSKIDAHY